MRASFLLLLYLFCCVFFLFGVNCCCSLLSFIAANILIDDRGETVKLADFNLSIKLDNGYQQDDNPRGTVPFMAPEVNNTCNYQ